MLIEEVVKSNAWNRQSKSIECNFYESADDVPNPKENNSEQKILYVTTFCFKNEANLNYTTCKDAIQILFICICHKTTLNFHNKQS